MDINVLQQVRETQPLIHNMTNDVVMNFSANGLLAFGAAPIMSNAEEDSADISRLSDGVLINIGTLDSNQMESMIQAGKAANDRGTPIVLDPVGVAATEFRTKAFHRMINHVQPTVIKGNAGELAHLVDIEVKTKGVESVGSSNSEEIAQKVARRYKTTAVVTGRTDVVSDGDEVLTNHTGHPLLAQVTGAGCLLGSIVTACLATKGTDIQNAYTAVEFYGSAAEIAASKESVHGPGTFVPHFLDALSISSEDWKRVHDESV